jgi:AraC-like DNA-binding protein
MFVMRESLDRKVLLHSDAAIIRNNRLAREWQRILSDDSPGCGLPLVIRNSGGSRWGQGVSVTRTSSNIFAIELVTKGSLIFVQSGREHFVESGTAFLLRRGEDHVYTTGPASFVEKRFLGFAGSLIDVVVTELGLGGIDVPRLEDAAGFERLITRANRLLSSFAQKPVSELALLAFEALLFVSASIVKPQYPPQIVAAIEYMQRKISSSSLGIKDLCNAAGIGQSHFFRLWSAHFTDSPIQYLRALRMKHAAALLEHSDLPIKKIAYMVGFEDLAYFSNVFRGEVGASPRGHRTKAEPGTAHSR